MFTNACVTLDVADLDAALAFWETALGLERRFRVGDWAEVSLGDFRLALRRVDTPSPPAGSAVGFGSDRPFPELEERLRRAGARVEATKVDREAGVRLLPFCSPQGHAAYVWAPLVPEDTPDAP